MCKVRAKTTTFATAKRQRSVNVENEREITVCFTGHRNYDGRADEALRNAIRRHYAAGRRIFITGMAAGFDLSAGESLVALRGELPGVQLHCAVPFAGHERSFRGDLRARYMRLLEAADDVVVLSPRHDSRVYHRRNDYMVEHSAAVIAWFDGSAGGTEYTLHRALQAGLSVENLWLGLFESLD